jgi:hypothetical protein
MHTYGKESTMRKPSPAMVVALLALFVALGGVGVAATGGNFILGKANTADATSYLTAPVAGRSALNVSNLNTAAGSSALKLNVASGHAPFAVNSPTRVPSLNADLLDNRDSTYFLPGSALRRVGPIAVAATSVFPPPYHTLAVIGQLTFIGTCYDEGAGHPQVVYLYIRSSVDHAAYADLTQAASGTTWGNADMTAGSTYGLAFANTASGGKVFTPVTGEALSADNHQVFYQLYMAQNARGVTNGQCVFGGSFAVK